MKTCRRCDITKPITEFSKARGNKDGHAHTCKPCVVIRNSEYWKTPVGRISKIYASQVTSSRHRDHSDPTYSRKELTNWSFENGLSSLHDYWKSSGFKKELGPSIDRLDPNKGYSLDNIRLVTWKENNDKAYEDRKICRHITKQNRRVNQFSATGELLATFDSVASAGRASGVQRTNINQACSKNLSNKLVGGFLWAYA